MNPSNLILQVFSGPAVSDGSGGGGLPSDAVRYYDDGVESGDGVKYYDDGVESSDYVTYIDV